MSADPPVRQNAKSADHDDCVFLRDMIRQMDATIRELAALAREQETRSGPERVEVLRELWDQAFDRQDELELGRTLDWRDRELLSTWARQRQAHARRAAAGQTLMRLSPLETAERTRN